MAKLNYDKINATVRYVMFSVFAARPGALGYDEESRAAVIDETVAFLKQQEENGVVVRGIYDVAGTRADSDFMIWTHAETLEQLQQTYSDFRRTTALGRATTPFWSRKSYPSKVELTASSTSSKPYGGGAISVPITKPAATFPSPKTLTQSNVLLRYSS